MALQIYQKGIFVDALGPFRAVPHTGTIILKLLRDAVTVTAEAPVTALRVGVRPPAYRNGATAFLAASDGKGSPLHVGVVLAIAASV